MKTNRSKKNTRICLDISSLFFHTVPKLVQLVITNDEIFRAPAAGDVPVPKPFLSLGFDGVVKCKSRPSEILFRFAKHVFVQGGQVGTNDTIKAEVQKWLWEQDVLFYRQGSENVIVLYEKCLNKFRDCVEK
jgi:hypothetical protein